MANKGESTKDGIIIRQSKKDPGIWYVRFRYKDANGVWKRTPTQEVIARTKTEARQKAKDLRPTTVSHSITNSATATVSSIVTEYKLKRSEDVKAGIVEASTVSSENSIYDAIAESCIGNKEINSLYESDIKAFIIDIKHHTEPKQAKMYARLKTLIKYAIGKKYLDHDPLIGIDDYITPKRPKVDEQWKASKTPSFEQVQNLITSLLNEPMDGKRCCLLICIFTGCRRGEAQALRWIDVDLNPSEPTIYFHQSLKKNNTIGKLKTKDSQRAVPIAPTLLHYLNEWKLKQQEESIYVCSDGDKFINYFTFDYFWKRYFASHGIGEIKYITKKDSGKKNSRYQYFGPNCHGLRKQAATQLHSMNLSDKNLQNLLGHASVATTHSFYTQAVNEQQRQAMLLFDQLFNPNAGDDLYNVDATEEWLTSLSDDVPPTT